MSWVSALPMCQEISMVMAAEAYEIKKFKTGHPVRGFEKFLDAGIQDISTRILVLLLNHMNYIIDIDNVKWSYMTLNEVKWS